MTTHFLTGTPVAAAFVLRPQRRIIGLILSLTAHGALAAWLLWSAPVPPPYELPPPAVMVTLSASVENNQTTKPLPVGLQQAVDSAASSKQETTPQLQKNITPPVNESAEIKLVQQRKNRKNSPNAANRYKKRRNASRIPPALPPPARLPRRSRRRFPIKLPRR